MTIPEIINSMVGDGGYENLLATVVSVDTDAKTCEVTTLKDEMTIFDVRLIANNGDGVLMTPSVDSIVGVCMINEIEGFVSLYSQVDSIKWGDGANGGLIKISDLVAQINIIETDLNTLKTAISGWVAVPNDGGAALKTATTAWAGASLTNTVNADIENDTITHGDL